MAKHFPSDFYVTCATVIPVLYLAVVLQGRTWDSLMRSAWVAGQARPKNRPEYPLTPARAMFVVGAATYVMLAGGVGEAFALLALYRGSDVPMERMIVLVAALFLVLAVVTVPAIPLLNLPQESEGEAPGDQDEGPGKAAESSEL